MQKVPGKARLSQGGRGGTGRDFSVFLEKRGDEGGEFLRSGDAAGPGMAREEKPWGQGTINGTRAGGRRGSQEVFPPKKISALQAQDPVKLK